MNFIPVISIVLTMMLISACSRNSERVRSFIANKNVKYWYRYYKNPAKPYTLGYRFNKDGTYTYYCIVKDTNRIVRAIVSSPSLPRPIWEVVSDTVLMFGQDEYYKIRFIKNDSIILKSLNDNEFLKLHRDTDQETKPENFIYWDTAAPPTM
jgi:hypothetical protein